MTKQQEAEARAELRPIVDALREWNNKYNTVKEDGDLQLNMAMIDTPSTGEEYFTVFNHPTECAEHFDFTIRNDSEC